jgi:rhamnosyltransferase
MPKVSVIIRAKNEERHLGETLVAIQGQLFRDYEVVLVDSGSADRTVEVASQYGARIVPIDPKDFTYGRALNLGVSRSNGQFLVSLSAHATPESSRWLGSLVSGFRYPSVAAVYGRHIPRSNVSLFELVGMHLSGVTSKEPRLQCGSARFSNTNGAFRRELWDLGPFDEGLPGAEDIEWARRMQRMGYSILFEPRAAVYHSHGEPLPRLLRRQLHDQPVILRAWLTGLFNGERAKVESPVRGREIVAK